MAGVQPGCCSVPRAQTPGHQVTVPGASVLAHTALGQADRLDLRPPFQLSHPSEPRRSLRGRGATTGAEKLLVLGTGFDIKNMQKTWLGRDGHRHF